MGRISSLGLSIDMRPGPSDLSSLASSPTPTGRVVRGGGGGAARPVEESAQAHNTVADGSKYLPQLTLGAWLPAGLVAVVGALCGLCFDISQRQGIVKGRETDPAVLLAPICLSMFAWAMR